MNIAILILAAGNSSRMNESKQLLSWKNSTLLEHTIETAKKIRPETVNVVLGANHEEIQSKIRLTDVNIIINQNWIEGIGTSIASGIKYITRVQEKIDGILIMLADQPLIDYKYLEKLTSQFKKNRNQIVVSSYEKGKYGVPALFDASYTEILSKIKGDHGAKKVISENSQHIVEIEGSTMVQDIDTIADYENLYRANH